MIRIIHGPSFVNAPGFDCLFPFIGNQGYEADIPDVVSHPIGLVRLHVTAVVRETELFLNGVGPIIPGQPEGEFFSEMAGAP